MGVKLSNFTDILAKVKTTCSNWYNLASTLTGKVRIVNTLIGSLFVYKMTTMANLSDKQIKTVEDLIKEFLWRGKKAKIAFETLKKDRKQGGLRLVDLSAKQSSIKIKWIFSVLYDSFLERCAYEALSPKIKGMIWHVNINSSDIKSTFDDSFWRQILVAWSVLNYRHPTNKISVLNEILWYNSFIRINKKVVMYDDWLNAGILQIKDLTNHEGELMSEQEFKQKWGFLDWLRLRSIKSAIPHEWKTLLRENELGETQPTLFDILSDMNPKQITRYVYDKIIDDKPYLNKYFQRWNDVGVVFCYEDYVKAFSNLSTIKITKYEDFQYRLLLKKIVTNEDLYDWGLKDSPECSFCGDFVEDIVHLMYQCRVVQEIIKWMINLCEINDIPCNMYCQTFILSKLNSDPKHIINQIAVYIKQFIYRYRCQNKKLTLKAVENEILYLQELEWYNAKRTHQIQKHVKKWGPIFPELVTYSNNISSATQ